MEPVTLVICVKVCAVAHQTAAHRAAAHLAARSAAAHLAAAHAAAHGAGAHAAKAVHEAGLRGTHPVSPLLAELAAGAATIGTLTFVHVYDDLLDEVWEKVKKRGRDIPVKVLRKKLNHAYQLTKMALEDLGQATEDELYRVAQFMERLLLALRSGPAFAAG
jgi:hypothetical protein